MIKEAKVPARRENQPLLTGLHKDGTSFPVEISYSPVRTATGRFSLAAVQDMTEVRSLAGPAATDRLG